MTIKPKNENGTYTVSRPSVLLDDRAKLIKWFNVGNTPNIPFTIIAHRCVEILEHFFETDYGGVLEDMTKEWAIEETNQTHEQERS